MVPIGVKWFLTRAGPCATAHLEAGGFIRSKEGISHPNIQFYFVPLAYKDHGRVTEQREAFQVSAGVGFTIYTITLPLAMPYDVVTNR